MNQIVETDTGFKSATIKLSQQLITNSFETNEKNKKPQQRKVIKKNEMGIIKLKIKITKIRTSLF